MRRSRRRYRAASLGRLAVWRAPSRRAVGRGHPDGAQQCTGLPISECRSLQPCALARAPVESLFCAVLHRHPRLAWPAGLGEAHWWTRFGRGAGPGPDQRVIWENPDGPNVAFGGGGISGGKRRTSALAARLPGAFCRFHGRSVGACSKRDQRGGFSRVLLWRSAVVRWHYHSRGYAHRARLLAGGHGADQAGAARSAGAARLERRFHARRALARFPAGDAPADSPRGLAGYYTVGCGVYESDPVALTDGVAGLCLDRGHHWMGRPAHRRYH